MYFCAWHQSYFVPNSKLVGLYHWIPVQAFPVTFISNEEDLKVFIKNYLYICFPVTKQIQNFSFFLQIMDIINYTVPMYKPIINKSPHIRMIWIYKSTCGWSTLDEILFKLINNWIILWSIFEPNNKTKSKRHEKKITRCEILEKSVTQVAPGRIPRM